MIKIDWEDFDPDSPEAQEFLEKFKIKLRGYPTGPDAQNARAIFLGRNDCIVIEPHINDDEIGFIVSVSGLDVTEDNIRTVVADQLGILADLIRDEAGHLELKEE